MRFLVAVALLVLAVAEAHHTAEHSLRGPRFGLGKTYTYDVELNATAGIWGLNSQLSKSVLKAELQIYAKTEKEYILKLTKVYTSGAVKAVEGIDDYVPLQQNRDLEEMLSAPIKFTTEEGRIKSYTLSQKDNFESRKIKKSILRGLEMYIPEEAHKQLESKSKWSIPVVYNETEYLGETEQHTTYWMITVSPNVEYPYHSNVYNISRSENFEAERYPSHKFHHNFDYMGCPDVCNMANESIVNTYKAGCPVGYEPHQSPMKTHVHHHHHLALEDGVMIPEIIESSEVHVAKMYDQDMSVLIQLSLKKVGSRRRPLEEPTGKTYHDLNNQEPEIPTMETECGYGSPRTAIEAAKKLLREIAQIIVRGNLEDAQSTLIGEKLILLKEALSKLAIPEFQDVATEIKRLGDLPSASEEEKVKRQVWMDVLPLVGTESSVSYISDYIKNSIEREVLVWEAKEILEALPQNIHAPTEKTIISLRGLLSLPQIKRNHVLHSAVHTCLGRVIGAVCNSTQNIWDSEPALRQPAQKIQRPGSYGSPSKCPKALVTEIVREIAAKLERTPRKDEKIIYIETLAMTGHPEVIPILSEYAYGIAEGMQRVSPAYYDFLRVATVYSFHKLAKTFPEDILSTMIPLYFNATETPKLRTAAFGVLIRCKPTLEVLQQVAELSWREPSNEVGSYVTSAMETFGNSTLPCMALTARRIQTVMPLLKRFDIGVQHAKNSLWTYFDETREFGLKGHLSYTPSNETFVPAAVYQALTYTTDSLTDTLIQSSLHVQGITMEKIFKYLDSQFMGERVPEFIPQQKENEIFEQANIINRIPEGWRLTVYKKMFYSSAFYYLDALNLKIQVDTLKQYLRTYLTKSHYDYAGHLVKTFLPSQFHVETVAQMLPYPVEFKMVQPIVLALKIESKQSNPTPANFHFAIRPSVYVSQHFVHQFQAIGECKRIGAYHHNKIAVSYPFEIKVKMQGLSNVTVSYKMPELPRKVLYYVSEAGTFAGKKSYERVPFAAENRIPIKTVPSPFQYSPKINIVGLPLVHINMHAEEIDLFSRNMPRTPLEALHLTVKRILNAGWRYRSVNVTFKEDPSVWPKNTEVIFNFNYDRTHVTKQNLKMSQIRRPQAASWNRDDDYPGTTDSDFDPTYYDELPTVSTWTDSEDQYSTQESVQSWPWNRPSRDEPSRGDCFRNIIPDEDVNVPDSGMRRRSDFTQCALINNGRWFKIAHVLHQWDVSISTRPLKSYANLRMEYNHTHSGSYHQVQVDARYKSPNDRTPKKLSFAHQMEFFGKPDEFKYDTHDGEQRAYFLSVLKYKPSGQENIWQTFDVIAGGIFKYESLPKVWGPYGSSQKDYRAEKGGYYHRECLNDIQDGHPLSTNCIKAMREQSIYNKLKLVAIWNKNMPREVLNASREVDRFFKHMYYDQMSVEYRDDHPAPDMIVVDLTHISKFSDEPLTDINITKPHEIWRLRRVKTLPWLDEPLSSLYGVLETELMSVTNNTYPPTCALMKNYVKTFDMRSYPVSLDRCTYVLSTHCTDYKNYAIIAKVLSNGQKEIHIHVAKHDVILTPLNGKYYSIKYDGRPYEVKDTLVFDEDSSEISVYAEKFPSSHHLQVVAQKAGIRVRYDGQNVKVQVSPRYKGETCGLCSEFDGETVREYRGVDKCLYSHPMDFQHSAITNRDQCRKQPLYPFMCEQEDHSKDMVWRRGATSGDEYEPTTKRNVVVENGNEICFSVHPVPVCEDNAVPTQSQTESVRFHCLPKNDITARNLVEEAKRRILGEIENKSVDYTENVEVAKLCSE